MITANGLEDIPTCASPDANEVELCKKWITKFAKKRKSINNKRWSYSLKHSVENWANSYVSNGAFIQAAVELGYTYEQVRDTPNANFNMIFPRHGISEYKEAFEGKRVV